MPKEIELETNKGAFHITVYRSLSQERETWDVDVDHIATGKACYSSFDKNTIAHALSRAKAWIRDEGSSPFWQTYPYMCKHFDGLSVNSIGAPDDLNFEVTDRGYIVRYVSRTEALAIVERYKLEELGVTA